MRWWVYSNAKTPAMMMMKCARLTESSALFQSGHVRKQSAGKYMLRMLCPSLYIFQDDSPVLCSPPAWLGLSFVRTESSKLMRTPSGPRCKLSSKLAAKIILSHKWTAKISDTSLMNIRGVLHFKFFTSTLVFGRLQFFFRMRN